MKPDRDGHYESRVPSGGKEGLILKSVDHPTFWKTLDGEAKAGMEGWYDKKADRWYTFSKGQTPKRKGLVKKKPPRPADIDPKVATKLRKQVNEALRTKRTLEDAAAIFDQARRPQVPVQEGSAPSPEQQRESAAGAVIEVVREWRARSELPDRVGPTTDSLLGPSIPTDTSLKGLTAEKLIANPTVLASLLNNPEVVSRIEDRFASLDQDIERMREPGQSPFLDPSRGAFKRALDEIERRAGLPVDDPGYVDAKTRLEMGRRVEEMFARRVREKSVTAKDTLNGYERIIQAAKDRGEPMEAFDSLGFREKYEGVYLGIVEQGLERQARALSFRVFERQLDPAVYARAEVLFSTGKLGLLSWDRLRTEIRPYLDEKHWERVHAWWFGQQQGKLEPGQIEGNKFFPVEKQIRHVLKDMGILTGMSGGLNPTPQPLAGNSAKAQAERRDFHNVMVALSDWVAAKKLPKGEYIPIKEARSFVEAHFKDTVRTQEEADDSVLPEAIGTAAGAAYGLWKVPLKLLGQAATGHPLGRLAKVLGYAVAGLTGGEIFEGLFLKGHDETQILYSDLLAREREAKLSGDPTQIQAAQALRKGTFREVGFVGGLRNQAALIGFDEGEIAHVAVEEIHSPTTKKRSARLKGIADLDNGVVPLRATEYIRDRWRLGRVKQLAAAHPEFSSEHFAAFEMKLRATGYENLGEDLTESARRTIETLFAGLGLELEHTWPPIEVQVNQWIALRSKLPIISMQYPQSEDGQGGLGLLLIQPGLEGPGGPGREPGFLRAKWDIWPARHMAQIGASRAAAIRTGRDVRARRIPDFTPRGHYDPYTGETSGR